MAAAGCSAVLLKRENPSYITSVFIRPPIFNLIFSPLSPASLTRVSHTCRLVYDAVSEFFPRAYNINRHLSHFFSNPIAFRSLQARTATLISGSNALQFLDRTFYPEADLDLYVIHFGAKEVGEWLMENEHYRFAPNSVQEPDFQDAILTTLRNPEEFNAENDDIDHFHRQIYGMGGVSGVFTFLKGSQSADGVRKVQIIAAKVNPFACILGFHSTCVMNFIAFDAAYSIYPKATFEERRALSLMGTDIGCAEAFEKYALRGWSFVTNTRPHKGTKSTSPFFFSTPRWVRDRHSWVVPLDISGVALRPRLSVTSIDFSWDPVVYNSWKLGGNRRLFMQYRALTSTILRYRYLVADADFLVIFMDFIRRQGTLEHMKVSALSQVNKLKLWTWWDSSIPEFYEVYLKKLEKLEKLESDGNLKRVEMVLRPIT